MNLSYTEYKAIVELSPNMIWRAGTDTKCNYFNDTWLRFTGKRMEDEIGDGWTNGVHPEDLDYCIRIYLDSFYKQISFEMEYRLMRYDGQWRWINDRGVPFFDGFGVFVGYIGSCMDVTEKVEGIKLTEMAHKDKLTGLFSRNYFDYLVDYEFHKARQEKKGFAIMMIDVDRFKFFNDHYGHSFGDKVLNQVAQRILTSLRKTDIAGRYGGDEFVVILHNLSDEEAQILVKRIMNSVGQICIDDTPTGISLSIGIVSNNNEKNVNEIIIKADQAMYQAKKEGGNRFHIMIEASSE
jgi:PAS domain S-box/diguanylate cyclase (GGDEF) domain